MSKQRFTFLMMALALASLALVACGNVEARSGQTVELTMVTHLDAGLLEQDAFVMLGPGRVGRIAPGDEFDADAPAFAAAEPIAHDLFGLGENPVGPYPAGDALGMTMGEWLGGQGHGRYTVNGQRASFSFNFDRLVPNAIYTLWCGRTTFPPNAAVVDIPCGDPDGTENTFRTDENGRAVVAMTLPALADSSKETVSFIAIAWHRDGQTYGAFPGHFGYDTHVQLFTALPPPDSSDWQTPAQ